MSTFTPSTTQQLVLDGAARRATEAAQAAFAHGRQHGWPIPEALLEASLEAERTLISLRGSMIGSGTWSADGGPVLSSWHQADPSEAEVAYERYTNGVRTAHGYVDASSRCITQTG